MTEAQAGTLPQEQPAPLREFWQIFKTNRLALVGFVIFILFFCLALFGVLATSGDSPLLDPSQVRLQEKLLPPLSPAAAPDLTPDQVPPLGIYLFGTDNLGRDVFARMLQGAWVSLTVGFVAVGIAVLIGIVMGSLAGYFGPVVLRFHHLLLGLALGISPLLMMAGQVLSGIALLLLGGIVTAAAVRLPGRQEGSKPARALVFLTSSGISVDTIIMRFVDIMLCFPSFFLILTVIALLPASIYNIMIVIGLTSWMGTARFVRAEFLSLREQDFVTAARALGVKTWRIMFRHMLPNAVAPVLVSATIGIATAILTEAGLSFLGFGVPPPQATWGNILSEGKRFIFDAPWLTLIPGVAILIVVLAFNLFGEGLRDALNPKLRQS
jgi:peptide/nickel transport system permease protein